MMILDGGEIKKSSTTSSQHNAEELKRESRMAGTWSAQGFRFSHNWNYCPYCGHHLWRWDSPPDGPDWKKYWPPYITCDAVSTSYTTNNMGVS